MSLEFRRVCVQDFGLGVVRNKRKNETQFLHPYLSPECTGQLVGVWDGNTENRHSHQKAGEQIPAATNYTQETIR